jgi:hypothetical protein
MAIEYFRDGIAQGIPRPDVDPDAVIDLLCAPLYYRLQMGTGALSDAYIDQIFEHGMMGLLSYVRECTWQSASMRRPTGYARCQRETRQIRYTGHQAAYFRSAPRSDR